ncbi:MAG: hypothetical protein GY787_12085 [Alteromonadales bacterium]|nr:hypothetical protein [Alteromonadales bacterium]
MSVIEPIGDNALPNFYVTEKRVQLLSINIHTLLMDEALTKVNEAINRRHSLHVGMLNSAKVVNVKCNLSLGASERDDQT